MQNPLVGKNIQDLNIQMIWMHQASSTPCFDLHVHRRLYLYVNENILYLI
jgi:hypothetical protein